MWSAIQSDLMEFVSTVQHDTKKTLDTVLGAVDERDEEEEHEKRALNDLRRSYSTYNESVDECDVREYEKFRKQFALSSHAVEIGTILDEEPDVPRYYAELVPAVMVPEEFWSRYFFKLKLLLRGAANPLDVLDDDEEIGWETNDSPEENADFVTDVDAAKPQSVASSQASLSSMGGADPEKDLMRKQIRVLVARVSELERALEAANTELAESRKGRESSRIEVSPKETSEVSFSATVAPEIPLSEPSPISDARDGSVVGSSVMSAFEGETNTDNSNHGASPKDASQKSKSETSLANLDDEEWEEDNGGWS